MSYQLTSTSTLSLPRALIDFETYSEQPLGTKDSVGSWRYAEDETTEILCMAYTMPECEPKLWTPDVPFPQELTDHVEAGYVIEAHNVPFERAIWEHILYKKMGIPRPKRYVDTMAVCAYRGLPMGLDQVGEVLNLPVKKDKRGKFLITKLCKPQKPTKKNPETRCQDWSLYEEMYDYCLDDNRAEECLGKTIGDLPEAEYKLWCMDQRINSRGVYVDMDVVYKAKKMVDTTMARGIARLVEITDGAVTKPTQIQRIITWLETQGVYMANLQGHTVEAELEQTYLSDEAREVLTIRALIGGAAVKKLDKFIATVNSDSRVRGLLAYHGAGTGRWAGRLVQPQNFPRGGVGDLPIIQALFKEAKETGNDKLAKYGKHLCDMDTLCAFIKTGDLELIEWVYGNAMEVISSALRGMFTASPGHELLVADFAAIEARVVMWLAGQKDAVQAFYDQDAGIGHDIYCVMASKLYKREITKERDKEERQLGKITILGCGYQMGGPRLREQASQSYGVELTEERAKFLVQTYREEFPMVPDLWRGLQEAAIECVNTGENTYYGTAPAEIGFEMVHDEAGDWLAMVLPNGRNLWYYNPETSWEKIPCQDKDTGKWKTFDAEQLSYEGKDNKRSGVWGRVSTYGGMLTENAVQAIARDLMVAAMIRAEQAGFVLIMTVHDELVAEAPTGTKTIEEFEAVMRGPSPAWAKGCPVDAEGWVGKRYRK
jgi:DNA polymerase